MTGFTPPLSATPDRCELEAIHVPGCIQPHGVLLCVDADSGIVLAASANHAVIPGLEGSPIGHRLSEVRPELAQPGGDGVLMLGDGLIVYRHSVGRTVFFEIEPCLDADRSSPVQFIDVKSVLNRLHDAETLEAVTQTAAAAIRRITGMERVLIYRFDKDDNGEVLAEDKVDDWDESFVGFHFPAADIPAQARALYLISPYRFVPHRDYQPVPLVPALDPRDGRPFDMSRCRLRGMSPVHRHYQKNLGVDGAMSLSILNEGRLWGLVVGHHRRPHRVPIPAREQVMALTISLSMRLSVTETAEERREHVRHTALHAKLLEQIAGSDDFVAAVMEGGITLTDLFSASSAAVVIEGDQEGEDRWRVYLAGDAPDREAVIAIARACRDRMVEGVFHTDRTPSILPDFSEHAGRAAGLLAVSVGEEARHAIIWFRPETVQTTIWGGATPAQVAQEKAAGNYLPRRSFSRWVEERRCHSQPWSSWEIEIARSIHTAVNDTILRQLRSIRGLNTLLKERDETKSRFLAHMSHELRAPLNTVVGFSDMLDQEVWGALTDGQRDAVACIREASGHLLTMINDILDMAKVEAGKMVPQLAPTNLSVVVARMITLQVGVAHAQGVAVTSHLEPDLPDVMVDERLVRQMLFNLLSNALKFTPRGGRVLVSSWRRNDGGVTLEVADTGIGIPKGKQAGVLEPFRQAHDHMKQGKGGTGLGLPIVKSLIELHGGRIELGSEEGRGTAVRLEFPPGATLGAVRPPSVRTVLRAATAEAHAALEEAPCLRRLFADDVSGADLAEVLGRFLPVYRALEARLLHGEPAASLSYASRVRLLAEGLNVLGAPAPPSDWAIPELDQEAARWGALYVIEGATMGGQVIQRQLVSRLGSGALSFFVPYGTEVGERWRSFLTRMENSLASPSALEEAKTSALAVFGLFHRALTE